MLAKKYTNIVYLIGLTIAVTIAVQCYWNYKMYEVHKNQFINQVQASFDKAVDDYYNNLAKTNILTFTDSDTISKGNKTIATVKNKEIKNQLWIEGVKDSNQSNSIIKIRSDYSNIDTLEIRQFDIKDAKHISVFEGEIDTLKLQNLTTKIMFSFQEKMVNLKIIDSLFKNNLESKKLFIPYYLEYSFIDFETRKPQTINYNRRKIFGDVSVLPANSSFLPHNSNLTLSYHASTLNVLSTMLGSILLSLLLAGIIIGCLVFLIKIIFRQKQLSEVKNDLISNITHEFKTPIATIAVALEGLQNFDAIKNPELTKNYLNMSTEQLDKLNLMVEKLLETASLEGNHFELHKEVFDIVSVLQRLNDKHKANSLHKKLSFNSELDTLELKADKFHIENALNNILDNAVKYGGESIFISIKKVTSTSLSDQIEISIEDNGNGIPQIQQKKIFEQFYRIPTGNVHNVKGFGIGLYYTKHIVIKHGGTILVESKKGKTVFKINLPSE